MLLEAEFKALPESRFLVSDWRPMDDVKENEL